LTTSSNEICAVARARFWEFLTPSAHQKSHTGPKLLQTSQSKCSTAFGDCGPITWNYRMKATFTSAGETSLDMTVVVKWPILPYIEWFIRSGHGPLERTPPHEFRICCFLVIIVSIVGEGPFDSFDPVMKTNCN
jgi:hypothetical protein